VSGYKNNSVDWQLSLINESHLHVQSSPSISTCRQRLKTLLFQQSISQYQYLTILRYRGVDFEMAIAIFSHVKTLIDIDIGREMISSSLVR